MILLFVSPSAFAANPKSQTLKFCYNTWFGRSETNSLRGPEVEIAEVFAKAIKWTTAEKKVTWEDFFKDDSGQIRKEDSYLPHLMKKDCDLYVANMTFLDWRLKKFDMVPFHAGRIFIVTKTERKDIVSINQLTGLKTAVTPNTTLYDSLITINQQLGPDKSFEIKPNPLGGSDKLLLNGEVDFIALDSSQALQVIKENPAHLAIAFPVGSNQTIGWAVSPKRKDIQMLLKKFVEKQRTDLNSQMNLIFKKYYGVTLVEYERLLAHTQK